MVITSTLPTTPKRSGFVDTGAFLGTVTFDLTEARPSALIRQTNQ